MPARAHSDAGKYSAPRPTRRSRPSAASARKCPSIVLIARSRVHASIPKCRTWNARTDAAGPPTHRARRPATATTAAQTRPRDDTRYTAPARQLATRRPSSHTHRGRCHHRHGTRSIENVPP